MGVSIREYARGRGVSDTAVHKAIKQGRIIKEPDGTIDVERADRDWLANTVSSQLKSVPNAAIQDVITTLQENGQAVSSRGNTFLEAKTANEIIKAKTNKLRFKQLNGELLERDKVCAQVFQLARQERDAWTSWPARIASQMAAQLHVDAHTLQVTLEQAIREHLVELGDIALTVE